jgi:hypothetical protein
MPADSAAGTGTINHKTVATTVPDRVTQFINVPSDACTLTSSDLNRPFNGMAKQEVGDEVCVQYPRMHRRRMICRINA